MNILKATSLLVFTGIILILQSAIYWVYHIEYYRLSSSISYGRTDYLLPNSLNLTSITILLLLGGLLLFLRHSRNGILFNVTLLLVASMIIFPLLSFLSQGYVVGDQPRAEFALGTMIIEGRVSLEEAEKISEYFRWPGLWIYEGTFSAITGISPFDAPVLLMVAVWLLLGLALITLTRRVYGSTSFVMATAALLLYTILNPYKIIHLCPQIYALLLFIIITSLLFKELIISSDYVVLLLLSMAVIISHPLTSVIVVGILLYVLVRNLITKIFGEINRAVSLPEASIISVLVFFVLWNIRFDEIIRAIVVELTRGALIQPLAPIAGVTLYSADTLYRAMGLFRYSGIFIMLLLALLSLFLHRTDRKIKGIFSLIITISFSSLLLNFIPGSFFHRVLYYTMPFVAVLSISSFDYLTKFAVRGRKLVKVSSTMLILVPLLSQLSIVEFITNNNPLATLKSPFESSIGKFIGNFYTYSEYSWSISSIGTLYYIVLTQQSPLKYTLAPSNSLKVAYLFTYLKEENITAIEKYVKAVYPARFFIVSPLERYVFYERTMFTYFHIIDRYLDAKNIKIYDNGLFRLYEAINE
ncbi:MAG: hypothetical protein QXL22_05960 [Candidatus Nezhaarchaeales archaeon]